MRSVYVPLVSRYAHARLRIQLSLLELRARLRGSGDDVRHRRALPRRGADHAEEGDRQGPAGEATVPHGTVRVEQSRRTLVHS